jgi:hypothetical protein
MGKHIFATLAATLLVADNLEKGGDPTNGGKLIPVHIVDKNGHHTVRYKTPAEFAALQSGGHDHQHVSQLAAGHRFTHAKNGETGTITRDKGHDGKGGHELAVQYDSGKKATAYVHNVMPHNPLEAEEEKRALPNGGEPTKPTAKKAEAKQAEPEEDHDDFADPDLLTPGERMQEWERMIYRLTKPGAGVNAAIAYGKGGVGKTYRAMKMLNGLKNAEGQPMQEGKDFVTFTGGTTAAALYETLYKNNGKLILLDDFDDVFKNEDCVNMLKGACDTSKKRIITSAKSQKPGDDDPFPNRFIFTGKIAFISNLNLDQLADKSPDIEALLSRADSMNLRMTNSQTVDLIKSDIIDSPGFTFRRADGKATPTTKTDKDAVMDFVDKHKHGLAELSVRTLGKINALRNFYKKKGESWEDKASTMLVRGKQNDMGVNERFDTYGDFVQILAEGGVKSVIAYGRGGIGKTYTAISKLEEMGLQDVDGMEEDPDTTPIEDRGNQYVHFSGGKFTPKGLYENLYKNNGRVIVIDDADTALTSPQAQAILKGALDTSGSGKVNWLTSDSSKKVAKLPKKAKGETDEDYEDRMKAEGLMGEDGETMPQGTPSEFEFKGRVLFISNLPEDKIAQPLQSRALTINTTMTRDQAIERFEHVAKGKRARGEQASYNVVDATHDDVDAVINHFKDINATTNIPDRHFNNRTIDRMLADKVHADKHGGVDWKRTVKTKLLKGLEYKPLDNSLITTDPIQKAMDNLEKSIGDSLDYFIKGGEGSKGGKVIGHTTSGKPIYAGKGPSHYSDFTAADHSDAAKAHDTIAAHKIERYGPKGSGKKHKDISEDHAHMARLNKTVNKRSDNNDSPKGKSKEFDDDAVHIARLNKIVGPRNEVKKALDFFTKGGEGSHGGHVIGHTGSGKAIYANHNAKSSQYAKFKTSDHWDAKYEHQMKAKKTDDATEKAHHTAMAASHDEAGALLAAARKAKK